MRISYNKLWKMLIDKNMKKSDLKEKAGISMKGTPFNEKSVECAFRIKVGHYFQEGRHVGRRVVFFVLARLSTGHQGIASLVAGIFLSQLSFAQPCIGMAHGFKGCPSHPCSSPTA